MSFNEVIEELPRLTFEERQILIRRALELDDPPLSSADESLVEELGSRSLRSLTPGFMLSPATRAR